MSALNMYFSILKHLKSAHFSTKNGYFSMFCGSISHAFSCKHEMHDLLTLVSLYNAGKADSSILGAEKSKRIIKTRSRSDCVHEQVAKPGLSAELQGWIANVRFTHGACLIQLNCRKIQEKTENKKTLKNLKKPLAILKNYAIISLACEGNENKETKQATIK